MTETEFDKYADEYYQMLKSSITTSGEKPEFFAEYKIADTSFVCKGLSLNPEIIFDFGSGIGNSIPWFRKYFQTSKLICADVSAKSLEISQKRFPGNEEYLKINGNHIDFPDESVDLIFTTCVFHHIPNVEHLIWLTELNRILKKNGVLIIFEHNPYNPLTQSTVRHCPFDINAKLIPLTLLKSLVSKSGFLNTDFAYRIFFPNVLSWFRPVEKYLTRIPLGAQYYLFSQK